MIKETAAERLDKLEKSFKSAMAAKGLTLLQLKLLAEQEAEIQQLRAEVRSDRRCEQLDALMDCLPSQDGGSNIYAGDVRNVLEETALRVIHSLRGLTGLNISMDERDDEAILDLLDLSRPWKQS